MREMICREGDYAALIELYRASFAPGAVVFLHGDLGTGKTTFIRHLAEELGIDDLVTSPSFAVANVYHAGTFDIAHLDLYRLDSAAQLEEIGATDFLDGRHLVLVEWPERCPGFFPAPDLEIAFALTGVPEERSIRITGGQP